MLEDERKKKKRRERGEQEERRKKERKKEANEEEKTISLSLSYPSSLIFTSIHFIELADQMKMSKLAA